MQKGILVLVLFFIQGTVLGQRLISGENLGNDHHKKDYTNNSVILEPFTYTNNFETRNLGAWASYPLWQDNAYDPNFQVKEFIPGDSNISIVQKVTPYSNVDNYAGAQKLLDMYLTPDSKISLRYYLKTNSNVDFFKIRLAAGQYGKIDVTLLHPQTNKWSWITVGFNDFVKENPAIVNKSRLRVYALAFLEKIAHADPDMPIYLALDDISFKGSRRTPFRFEVPKMYKLPEFEDYIPNKPYQIDDTFRLKGQWPLEAQKVTLEISKFTNENKSLYHANLNKKINEEWEMKSLKLSFPDGLYKCKLIAYRGSLILSETDFTIHIAPKNLAGIHPRLLFDAHRETGIKNRFMEKRFQPVYADILKDAKIDRENTPVGSLIYDLDQFPDENWLPSWTAFGTHIYNTGDALKLNAFAYSFNGDTIAGNYAKNVLVTLAGWPNWISPWMIKRGRFSDHRMGTWSHDVALAYDLTYNLMTSQESAKIRKAIMKNIVQGAYHSYVYNDEIISNTSNWIGHIIGGALMNMAAIADDGPETENMEPYFTGAMLKFYSFLNHVTDTKDGAWGEGFGYNNYTFSNLSYSVPSLKNVYNIDVTDPLAGTYNEYIWGGLIRDRKWFGFGDSNDSIESANNWAFLLSIRKSPRLSWYYNYLKEGETLNDLFFDTQNIPTDSPFNDNPVKVFKKVGTTVFKSGWGKNDFVFVMRTGAFFNHQHLDQGSFWLADRGITFIEDQPIHNSDYYIDPLYQSNFIQPIAHSTILINNNAQSQRTGDPLNFAPGFDDNAFISQFLDTKNAAFSRGDIGRLYWNKVKSLSRNVLFIKPHTLLMLDEIVPGKKNVDVTLLYHTKYLKDISASTHISKITKDGVSLNLIHLSPDSTVAKAVETPHYLNTLLKEKPLIKEGMLTLSATTKGRPLIMANLLTTTKEGVIPDVTGKKGDGFVSGVASGKKFAFSIKPDSLFQIEDMETNALVMTWDDSYCFVAMATIFRKEGITLIESDTPLTFELRGNEIQYSCSRAANLIIHVDTYPSSIIINGVKFKNFSYNKIRKTVAIQVFDGSGTIVIKDGKNNRGPK
jgi:hypothetical protein